MGLKEIDQLELSRFVINQLVPVLSFSATIRLEKLTWRGPPLSGVKRGRFAQVSVYKEPSWKAAAGLGVDAAGSEKARGPTPFSCISHCNFFVLSFFQCSEC